MARNLSKKTRRQIKARKVEAGQVVATSDDGLRSVLGFILHRLWLYSGSLPGYQAAYLIRQGEPLVVEREGYTHYYR